MSAIKRRRGLYSKQQLIDAVRAVKEGEMTSVKAADEYKVPAGTIRFHVNNDSLRIGGGRSFYLSSKQEDYLVELIKSFETIGVPLTKIALRMIVGQYIKLVTNDSRYKKNQPSIHWLKKFLVRRKKEIKMVKEKQIEKSRRDGFTEDVRSGWFSNLKEVLDKNDLLYKPLQIWNMDESGFSDETQNNGGTGKAFTTVVVCGNAAGICLPPYTIYAAKNVNKLWCEKGPDRSQYKCSNKGWINEELFVDWFQNLFLVETANIARPLLLLMDNLSSHVSIKAIELAQQHQVVLMCLPPNTTHALQPLDVTTFG
ncbi:unnamed protein product, partial [Rotaria magnacalcarata]